MDYAERVRNGRNGLASQESDRAGGGATPPRFANSMLSMKLLFSWCAPFALACLLAGCADTRTVMVGTPRPAIRPESVRVYQMPPRRFDRIAILNSSGGTSWIFADQPSMDLAISRLREQAAKVGANGILLQQVYDEPAGASRLASADSGLAAAAAITTRAAAQRMSAGR